MTSFKQLCLWKAFQDHLINMALRLCEWACFLRFLGIKTYIDLWFGYTLRAAMKAWKSTHILWASDGCGSSWVLTVCQKLSYRKGMPKASSSGDRNRLLVVKMWSVYLTVLPHSYCSYVGKVLKSPSVLKLPQVKQFIGSRVGAWASCPRPRPVLAPAGHSMSLGLQPTGALLPV